MKLFKKFFARKESAQPTPSVRPHRAPVWGVECPECFLVSPCAHEEYVAGTSACYNCGCSLRPTEAERAELVARAEAAKG